MMPKIVSRAELTAIVQELKQRKAVIVTTNGSFDLLHIGHVTMLQEAKSLGDVLIVGVNSDASVRRYKGKSRPICPQEHRAGMLAALACTDYITIFDEATPIELLSLIQPNIHVNSPEHGLECVERDVVEQQGGRIHLSRFVEGMSTSQLLKRILETANYQPARGMFLNVHDLLETERLSSLPKISQEAIQALQQFQAAGFRLFLWNIDDTLRVPLQQRFAWKGVTISKMYHYAISPDMPENTLYASKMQSLENAGEEFDLSLAKSVIISSELADIRIGRDLNCKTIFFKTPFWKKAEMSASPHHIVESWQDAIKLIGEKYSGA